MQDKNARQRIAELAAVIGPRVAKALERQRQLLSEPSNASAWSCANARRPPS